MKTELLAPAGTFDAFIEALYNGADAIYLGVDKFGARAYAKNFTIDELKLALSFAHIMGKKIYVTINTIIKENELEDCKEYIKELYKIGVDGIIVADIAIFSYLIKYFPKMECHISTQAGIKDIEDIRFFESIKANRCVLAREMSLDEIKKIKQKSKMPIEVFAYGALCVSYSGGCLFSSLLSLRSGNRGRCAQNCRREYSLYKDNKLVDKGFMLSMKDLNTSSNLKELTNIGVDSLKIEGRMKSPEYVRLVVSEYRKKLDNPDYKTNNLDRVFHRAYTKGFINNEDRGNIVDITKKSNEGAYIGKIKGKFDNLTLVELTRPLNIKDRIRIEGKDDYYFTIDKIYNLNKKEIKTASSECLLNIYQSQEINSKIYKMIDSTIISNDYTTKKIPLNIDVYGAINTKLLLSATINDIYFEGESTVNLDLAKTSGISIDSLYKNLDKIKDTPFYLNEINNYLEGNLFMTVSGINEARRNLINNIMLYYQNERNIDNIKNDDKKINYLPYNLEITAHCKTKEQFLKLKELGIKTIYYNNYSPYVNAKYQDIDEDYILIGNYGGINHYKNKILISDYTFNVINSDAIHNLVEYGINYVTLSLETDYELLKEITTSYKNKYNHEPPIEFVVYGYQTLMNLKYCPLKRYGECGKCQDHTYTLKDNISEFKMIRNDCYTQILNSLPLNLIPNLNDIIKYAKRLRLNFTVEDSNEVELIINSIKNKLNGENEKAPNSTKGYFKRPIL